MSEESVNSNIMIENFIKIENIEDADKYYNKNRNFSEMGINSVEFVKLIILIEDEYNIQFEDEMIILDNIPTVNSLLDYVTKKVVLNMEHD